MTSYYIHLWPSLVIPTIKHFILQLPIGSIFSIWRQCSTLVPHANNPLNRMIESRISLTKSIPFINKLETLQYTTLPLPSLRTAAAVSNWIFIARASPQIRRWLWLTKCQEHEELTASVPLSAYFSILATFFFQTFQKARTFNYVQKNSWNYIVTEL